MKRKLIQHGHSSLTVSLPRKWIIENNLKKGDEIELDDDNEFLTISTDKNYIHKNIELDISNSNPMIRKILGATFKSGYNQVKITFSSHNELKAIQEVMREQFTGFEIIDQNRDHIVIKNLSQTNFEEFNNVLRRFFLIIEHIASETHLALSNNDMDWMRNTALQKIESDKCADFCRRAINMKFQTELERTAPLYTIIEQLEKIPDRYKDLSSYITKYKIKPNKELISTFKEIAQFLEQFYNLYYKFEISKITEFGKIKESLQKKIDNLAIKSSKEEYKIITLLDRILNLIYDLNGPLMATHIQTINLFNLFPQ